MDIGLRGGMTHPDATAKRRAQSTAPHEENAMSLLSRREMLRTAGAGAAALALAPVIGRADEKHAGYTLPKLPYATDALQPSIDARTMEIHHDRHHKAY